MHFTRASMTGGAERVDVVALQQRDLADSQVFQYVMTNRAPQLMKYLVHNDSQLNSRDSVGATPLLIAFLYMNFDLGKEVIMAYPVSKGFHYALASYDSLNPEKPSPYQEENILHIAIVHRKLDIVEWLVQTLPDLLDAETTGEFFSPGHPCYFGGSPLLFALSSRQLEAAECILEVANNAAQNSRAAKTSIFMMDSFGNNALHMAVIHDLPDAYDFAVRHAMARFPNACPSDFNPSVEAPYDLPLFRKKLHGIEKEHFERFIRKHNTDYLTPLTLAAAMGRARMFKHILLSLSIKSWTYGPVTSMMIPLRGLEERVRRPKVHKMNKKVMAGDMRPTTAEIPSVETSGRSLHEPSWWQWLFERKNVKTAVECLGSNSKLSICIADKELRTVLRNRLEMIDSFEVKMVLDKKWDFAGRDLFMWNFRRHYLFCLAFSCSTFYTYHYRNDGFDIKWSSSWSHILLEFVVVLEMLYRILYEIKQIRKNGITGYLEDTGAAMVDNILKISCCILTILAIIFRILGDFIREDACISVALLCTYLYFFFFLFGFRSTGPFIVMIMRMLVIDVGRFVVIYIFVLTGFGISLYVIVDQRAGFSAWLNRMKSLALASFCSTFTWTDYENLPELGDLSQLLIFTYLFIVAIVFLNLLIATMGNTYEAIYEASEQQWYAERANIMSSMEITLTKSKRESNRKRYAVELEGERYLQVEYVNSLEWLGGKKSDSIEESIRKFKHAIAEYQEGKETQGKEENPEIRNVIELHISQLEQVLLK